MNDYRFLPFHVVNNILFEPALYLVKSRQNILEAFNQVEQTVSGAIKEGWFVYCRFSTDGFYPYLILVFKCLL